MADNYGLVDNASDLDNSLKEKYTDYSKHKLKKCLRLLKANEPENLNEIRFVSKLLRSKIQTEQSSVTTTSAIINQNELINQTSGNMLNDLLKSQRKYFQLSIKLFAKNISEKHYSQSTLQSDSLSRPVLVTGL